MTKREGVYQILERELESHHQAYWIFPRIGSEETEQSAIQGFEIAKQRFPKYHVALLTGRSKNKTEVIQSFLAGNIDILVGTTITEVGISCDNANVVIIENANLFGLATLHQIRGRVCRSKNTSFCFLVAETANQTSINRLEVIEKCTDGFEISEHDLRLRGPGSVFGVEQSGLPDFKHASLVADYDLILEARKMVQDGSVGEGTKEFARMRYDLDLGEVK